MSLLDDDLAAMLRDEPLTALVRCGADETRGWRTRADLLEPDEAGLHVAGHRTTVAIQRGTLAAAKYGVPVTVDGEAFVVQDRRAEGDGRLERLFLAEA